MAQLGFRTLERDGGPRRQARDAQGDEPLEGQGPRLSTMLYSPEVVRTVGRYMQDEQDHGLEQFARHDRADGPLRAGARARRRRRGRAADPQRQSHRRHDPRQRDHAQLRREGPARRHDPPALPRLGGPELRRVHPAGHDLSLEGDANDYSARDFRAARSSSIPPAGSHVLAGGQHHRRQRRALRRNQRRGLSSAAWPANASRAQQRRERRRRGRRRPWLRVHDRRTRGRARRDGPQFRARACPAASPTCSTSTALSART